MVRQFMKFNFEEVPLSKSGIHMYRQCPKRFEYMVIQDLGLDETNLPEAMVIGTIFHDAAEKLYDQIDMEAVLSGAVSIVDEYCKYMPYEEHYRNFIDMEQTRFDAIGGVGKVTRDFFPLHRELYMEDKELMFYGTLDRIDRIDGEYAVIDYKVSKYPKYSGQLSKYRLELAGYAHLAEVTGIVDKPVKYIGVWFMKTGNMMFEELKPRSRKALHDNIRKVREGVQARMLDRKPGWGCDYCPYVKKCNMDHEKGVE